MLDTQTEDEKIKKDFEKAIIAKLQFNKQKDEEAKRLEEEKQKRDDESDKKSEESQNEEHLEEEDDEIEYEVFYNDSDIR
jgi:hypothetical protein